MASFHLNQVRGSGCSKAQASLNKILHTISSVKPPRRFDIDLNLSLVDAFWEFEGDGDGGNLDACSFVGKQIDNDSSGNNNGERTKEDSCSDITNLHDVLFGETKEDHETKPSKEQNGNDCFGLLIAAAELISRTEAESSPSQYRDNKEVTLTRGGEEKATGLLLSAGESTRGVGVLKSSPAEVDGTSAPVVRSKRLPYRYRDSVLLLEPSKRRREPNKKRRARQQNQALGS